ncbi:MAG TPA: adenylate kinase [Bacteroidales bacterium]|nr:adenylate kinase [Bacteroidales bacterium]
MLNIIIFGPPGSGKGTQSARIVEKYNLSHLSTGALFREEMAQDTPLGREMKRYIDKGKLVPDNIVLQELTNKAGEFLSRPGLIFDGFPRTIPQAENLDQMLKGYGEAVDMVISVEVSEQELFQRLMGRSLDSGRSDDNSEIIWHRIEVYKEQTFPLIEYYQKQGKLAAINGMAPVDEVFKKISKAIDFYIETKEVIAIVN